MLTITAAICLETCSTKASQGLLVVSYTILKREVIQGKKGGCSAVLSDCPKRSGQGVLLLLIAPVTKNVTLCRPECKQPDLICAINTTTGRAVGTAEVHSANQHGHHLPHRGTASCSAADTGFCGSCYSVQVFFFFP